MTIGTRLYTWWRGQFVGEDEFGNAYYQDKYLNPNGRRARWVVYEGMTEASKVPAAWHRWLHYTTDEVPSGTEKRHAWEKPHLPNLTGTKHAYVPPGHLRKGGKRYKVSSDYEAWRPE